MSTDVNDTLVCGCFYFKDDLEEDQVKFSEFKKAAKASSFLLTHSDFCLGFQRVIWAVQLRNKGWMYRLWGYHPSTRGLFTPVCFVLLHATVPGTGLLLARNSCTFQEMSFSAVIKHTTWLCRGRDCALLLGGAGRAAASLQPTAPSPWHSSARCQPILWGWLWKEVLHENDFTSCKSIPILDFKFSTLSPEWNACDWAVYK